MRLRQRDLPRTVSVSYEYAADAEQAGGAGAARATAALARVFPAGQVHGIWGCSRRRLRC